MYKGPADKIHGKEKTYAQRLTYNKTAIAMKLHRRVYSELMQLPKMKAFKVKSRKINPIKITGPTISSHNLDIKLLNDCTNEINQNVLQVNIKGSCSPIVCKAKDLQCGLNTSVSKLDDTIKQMLEIISNY